MEITGVLFRGLRPSAVKLEKDDDDEGCQQCYWKSV